MYCKHIILFIVSVYSASAFTSRSALKHKISSPIMVSFPPFALVAASVETTTPYTSCLHYKNHPDETLTEQFTTTNSRSLRRKPQQDIYLPRRSDQAAERARAVLQSAELFIGRLAMLAALVLLGIEVFTGTSFPEQMACMLAS